MGFRSTAWAAVIALHLIILTGCWSDGEEETLDSGLSITALAPEAAPPRARATGPTISTLFVPVAIPISEISALVNRVVPDSIFHARNMEVTSGILGVDVDLDIVRAGPIETYTAFGSVFTRLPLAANGRVRLPPGMWRPFETSFYVNATTDLSLDRDWATHSTTHAVVTWADEPSITIAGIRFGLRGVAEGAINEQLARLTPEIDRIVEREVNLRREAEKVWADLASPLPINETPPTWLLIRPDKPYYSPPESRGDTIVVELRLEAYVETIVGDSMEAPTLGELPSLEVLPESAVADSQYGFTVHLPVSVTYEDARSVLGRALSDRKLAVAEQVAVELDNIELYGRGEALVARVDFFADVADAPVTSGRIYFTGLPTFDPETQTIRVDSFDYDVQSRSVLADAAAWILKQGILEETRSQLEFEVGPQIQMAREQLETALRYQPLGRHIILSGTLEELTAGDIYLVADGINVDILATGKLEVLIGELDAAVKVVPRLVK